MGNVDEKNQGQTYHPQGPFTAKMCYKPNIRMSSEFAGSPNFDNVIIVQIGCNQKIQTEAVIPF